MINDDSRIFGLVMRIQNIDVMLRIDVVDIPGDMHHIYFTFAALRREEDGVKYTGFRTEFFRQIIDIKIATHWRITITFVLQRTVILLLAITFRVRD